MFTPVVYFLSCMLHKASESERVQGLMIGLEGLEISHLQIAYETFLFLLDIKENFQNMLSLLHI